MAVEEKPYDGFNGDLLDAAVKRAEDWEQENDFYFSPSRFVRFSVLSKLAPQLAESFFLEEVVFPLARKTKSKKQLMLPRKNTKSSIAKALCCFLLCDWEGHQWGKQVRINFCGETKGFATRSVKAARRALETNEYILGVYGPQKPSKESARVRAETLIGSKGNPEDISPPEWTQGSFRTQTCVEGEIASGVVNEEPSLWADGVDVSSTGCHMDVVIFDDLVGRHSFKSPLKKGKAIEFYKDKKDQIMKTGLLLDIGTVWAEDDIHNHITVDHYDSFDFVVHTIWGTGPELEQEDFEKGEDGIYRVVGPKAATAEILWDGFEQLTDEVMAGKRTDPAKRRELAFHYAAQIMIEDKKGDAGSWAKQYLNRVVASEDQLYYDWMFRDYLINNQPKFYKYILTDSATGKDNRSSYRVVATVGLDSSDVAYVIDLDFGRWSPDKYIEVVLEHHLRYDDKATLFEKVAWQEAFKTVMDLKCQIGGIRKPKVLDVPGRSTISKLERMEGMEPRFRASKILFNPKLKEKECEGKNVMAEIIAQFKRVHECDQVRGLLLDIPDALSDIDATDLAGKRLCKHPKSSIHTTGPPMNILPRDVMAPLVEAREKAREAATGTGSIWGGGRKSLGIPKNKRESLW